MQIWVDPKRRTAYRDPMLLEWLQRVYAARGALALIRFNEREAIVLLPPAATGKDFWSEVESPCQEQEHRPEEIAAALVQRA